jgi:hypothetical protein
MQCPRYANLWRPAFAALLVLALATRPSEAAFMAWECAGVVMPPDQTPTPTISSQGGSPTLAGSPTPEPASVVSGLVGAGLAGLAAWRRKRRARGVMEEEESSGEGAAA